MARLFHRDISALILIAMIAAGCSKSPTTPTPAPTPNPVTQAVQVVSSDGRTLGSTSFAGTDQGPMTITVQNLRDKGINMDSVDANFLAIREQNAGEILGAFVANSTTGSLSFTPQNNTRIIWGMNATNSTDYGCAWNTGFGKLGIVNRYATVRKLTPDNNTVSQFSVVSGDTAGIEAALVLLNGVWTVGGVKYGSLTWIGDAGAADLKGGRGSYTAQPGAGGAHFAGSFVLAPILTFQDTRALSIEEALESYSKDADDICGRNSVESLWTNFRVDQDLNARGKDYVRFVPLMSK